MPAPVIPELVSPMHRIGPYDVAESRDILTLRMENRGEFTLKACLVIGVAMFCILIVGIMSIVQAAEITPGVRTMDSSDRFFNPSENHFGFLWLFFSCLMIVLVPLYVAHAYKATITFTFDKVQDRFLCGKKKLCHLHRIEALRLSEVKDADARFLYTLDVIYGDGRQLLLHNGYDEREAMNLANEVSIFVRRPVQWR